MRWRWRGPGCGGLVGVERGVELVGMVAFKLPCETVETAMTRPRPKGLSASMPLARYPGRSFEIVVVLKRTLRYWLN